MKKLLALIALVSFIAVGLSAQNMAAVTVRHTKTEPISAQELLFNISQLEQQNGRVLTADERDLILERMIDTVLLIQEAEADNTITATDDEVSQAAMGLLSQQLQYSGTIPPGAMITDKAMYLQFAAEVGINVAEYELTVRQQILVEKLVAAREAEALNSIPRPTEAELAAQYQARIQEFVMADSVWFKQIFFQTQGLPADQARAKAEEAREVYRRLMNTTVTFEELVASESEDEQSRAAGGETGPVMMGDTVALQIFGQPFMDTVFSMGIGDVSEPLQSGAGYHIVKISRKEAARLLPQDDLEVQQYLERLIYSFKFQQAFDDARNRLAASLRETATIRYIGEYAEWSHGTP